MDELKRAKLDLPPPGQPNEFPQRPFGVFQEPNFEAKVIIKHSKILDLPKFHKISLNLKNNFS